MKLYTYAMVIGLLERFLVSSNIKYELVKKGRVFTQFMGTWTLRLYVIILFKGKGGRLAAIIGLVLRQDAVGIFIDNDGGLSHPVFTLSTRDSSLIEKNRCSRFNEENDWRIFISCKSIWWTWSKHWISQLQ